ncbi:hypothetical protein MMC13_008354 [Lambiella insularis]|nr:hypothetical protein [Lambiella insularis]
MDPLSISASITGLIAAAVQVSALLKHLVSNAKGASASAQSVLAEVSDIGLCLNQLQGFLLGSHEVCGSRTSLIMIDQVIVVLTNCVSIFSELEQTIEMLKTEQPTKVIDKVKWARKETVISKILGRLQASKASLNLMLTTLTCPLPGEPRATSTQVQPRHVTPPEELERMHPAWALSVSPSHQSLAIPAECDEATVQGQSTNNRLAFEEDLWTSRVYQKAAVNEGRFSMSSCTGSLGLSFLSGLSLSDISNVSAIALPILSKELWNHHRYTVELNAASGNGASLFDAWYNPPSKKSAFIRTAYFNGQYTNQYAQSKSTGHLLYRRFTVTGPQRSPAFVEGSVITRMHQAFAIGDSDHGVEAGTSDCQNTGKDKHAKRIHVSTLSYFDSSPGWTREVVKLLEGISY